MHGPLLTGSMSVVSGATYEVKVEVKIGDLDGDSGEYVDISVDGKSSHRCTPTGTSAGSCNWYDCSGISDMTASSSSVDLRLQYGSGYDSQGNGGPCTVDGVTAYAAARITFTPRRFSFLEYPSSVKNIIVKNFPSFMVIIQYFYINS